MPPPPRRSIAAARSQYVTLASNSNSNNYSSDGDDDLAGDDTAASIVHASKLSSSADHAYMYNNQVHNSISTQQAAPTVSDQYIHCSTPHSPPSWLHQLLDCLLLQNDEPLRLNENNNLIPSLVMMPSALDEETTYLRKMNDSLHPFPAGPG
jgi:hypothetical protein